jgi:polysaccharide export outer membrane protein
LIFVVTGFDTEGAKIMWTKLIWVLCFGVLLLSPRMPAIAADADYALNPGDILQITVWKEDGLDKEILVLPDGTVSFPLVGTLTARGKTVAQLQQEIKTKLATDIPDASVTVVVKTANGNVVDVIGQVNKPGEINTGHRVTVMQALSIAGGVTPYAATGKIKILRHGPDGKETAIVVPYNDIMKGESLDKDVILLPGDVVVVPEASLF